MANSKSKCCSCKRYFIAVDMIKTQVGKFCTDQCRRNYGIDKADKIIAKLRAKKDKEHLLRKKVMNDSDLTRQHALTQKAFNKLRKLQEFKWFADRNIEPYCISCGKTNMDWACGHYKSRGHQGALRYDLKNTYLQCNRYCNMALSGNISGNKTTAGYEMGLIHRFGADEALLIVDYCERDRIRKWECSELIEMRKAFNKEIKQLTVGEIE